MTRDSLKDLILSWNGRTSCQQCLSPDAVIVEMRPKIESPAFLITLICRRCNLIAEYMLGADEILHFRDLSDLERLLMDSFANAGFWIETWNRQQAAEFPSYSKFMPADWQSRAYTSEYKPIFECTSRKKKELPLQKPQRKIELE